MKSAGTRVAPKAHNGAKLAGAARATECLLLADTVEKVGRESRVRNNRIEKAYYLNQRCVGDSFFESKLRGGTLKIFFQQHRPIVTHGV
jgi:hypothetical protein